MTKYRFNNVDFPDFDALKPALAAHMGVADAEVPPHAIHATGAEGEAPGSGGIYFMPEGGWKPDTAPAFTYERAEDGARVVTPA